MFRRLSQQPQRAPAQNDLNRSATYGGGQYSAPSGAPPGWNGNVAAAPPTRQPQPRSDGHASVLQDLEGLSIGADAPPSYQTALGASTGSTAPSRQPATTTTSSSTNAAPSTSSAPAASVTKSRTVEDPLATLGRYDIALIVDDSPSMVEFWSETRQALMSLVAQTTKYDKDGCDLYFLNSDLRLKGLTEPSAVREAFETVSPSGSTPTGFVLDEVLREYVEQVEDAKTSKGPRIKPLIVLILTDGRADDSDMVKDILVEMAQRLDDVRAPPFQLGVQFIQIGPDEDAADFLRQLDDDLKAESGVRDIVDTIPYQGKLTSEWILKCLLGSVNKRLDGSTDY